MAQAVASDRLTELSGKIKDVQTRAAEQMAAAEEELAALKTELQQEVSNISLGVASPNGAHIEVAPARKKPGPKPKHGKAAAATPTPKKKPGPKPKHGGEAAPKGKRAPRAEGASRSKQVFHILDRGKWPEVNDLPAEAPGLTYKELWKFYFDGNPDFPTTQKLQYAIHDLRKRGKIERGEDKRLFVVEGATMD